MTARQSKQSSSRKTPRNKASAPDKKTGQSAPLVAPHDDTDQPLGEAFFVVGLGASAGGLETLEQFFTNMAPDSGMAFVVVVHLDPTHKTLLPELLGRYTRMEVCLAEEGMTVEPNRIYVIPANRDMTLSGGELHLDEPVAPRGMRHTIDVFFRSLAADMEENAIAVILSGTGTDGTQGVKAIKESGGIVVVQEMESAKYPGMPQSAIATGLADLVIPVQEMPEKIREIVNRTLLLISDGGKDPSREIAERLRTIFRLVKAATGHDFSSYKTSTVMRRIERRMAVNNLVDVADYLQRLKDDPEEATALFKDILIGVTSFFRDPEAFAALREQVLPQVFAAGEPDEPLRIWLAGCATGEEAYSAAILLREYAREHHSNRKVQIFATDLDSTAIEVGRAGLYPDSISADVSVERLRTFFKKSDSSYQVNKPLREMIVFAQHNLIKDPPFSKLDLLVCRNLLIYLKPEMQKRLLPLFFQALKPNGFLFLGTSETVGGFTDLFRPLDKKWKIFQRRAAARKVEVDFPAMAQRRQPGELPPVRNFREEGISPGALAEKTLIQRYSPPCVVINEKYEVVYFSTRTSRYLEPPVGEPSQNILKMAKDDLRPPLRAAIHKAFSDQEPALYKGLKISSEAGEELLDLKVEPITEPASAKGLALVVFEPQEPALAPVPVADRGQEPTPEQLSDQELVIRQLEEQLRITHAELQATIERLETSNEELKSSNEELMSMNEEFQSTNEELETSKEELQALNEELVTVNAELESKVDELAQASNDMQNLLNSSDIATIFLDRQLQVKRFTPAMAKIFNLIDSDLGRPLQHISGKINYPELQRDAIKVLEDLTPLNREVGTGEEGRVYQLRVLPYRTMEDVIDGVVVTLFDLTDRIKAEEADSRLAAIVESSDDAIFSKDLAGTITSWNKGAERIYGYRAEEIVGQKVTRLEPDDRLGEMDKLLNKLKHGKRLTQLETRRRRMDGRIIDVSVTISPLRDHHDTIIGASSVARDITGRKALEKKLQCSIELEQSRANELQTLLETVPAAVLTSHDPDCKVITGNRASYELLRIPPGENTSKSNPEAPVEHFRVLHDGRELQADELPIQRAAARGEASRDFEEEIVFDNGDRVILYGNAVPLLDLAGNPAGAVAAFVDITQRVQAEEELRIARRAADSANRAKSLFLANMSHELRTPLTGVLGMLDLLGGTPLSDEQRELQQTAVSSGKTLLGLINDVLDFSKIEAGQLTFAQAPVELRHCILEAIQIVSYEAKKKQLPITLDCPAECDVTVKADCPRLHQVLFNLLGNAVKFTDTGEIRVSLSVSDAAEASHPERRMIHVAVTDTGIGIPGERQAEIFESFTQVDNTTSRDYGGTGLGLAITKSLIEGMGGAIEVRSEPGVGSTFAFSFPAEVVTGKREVEAPAAVREENPVAAAGPSEIKVLVAEDEPILRGLMKKIFQQRNHQAVIVGSGKEAIARWQAEPFDVILMDVQMPGMDGLETARKIRKLEQQQGVTKRIPVIALTAHARKEDVERCRAAGMDDHISKPIEIAAFYRLIEKYGAG